MGQRKNKLTKKQRKLLQSFSNDFFVDDLFSSDFDDNNAIIIGDENPDSGEMHYTDFVCSHCGIHEDIPTHIVMQFEDMDRDTPNYMPAFFCEKCGNKMYPTYFKGYTGKIYQYKFKG